MKTTPSKFRPFHMVTDEKLTNNKVIIVAGNVRVSPLDFDSEEDAEKYLEEQPYEMFTNLYSIFRYYEKEDQEHTEKDVAKS